MLYCECVRVYVYAVPQDFKSFQTNLFDSVVRVQKALEIAT